MRWWLERLFRFGLVFVEVLGVAGTSAGVNILTGSAPSLPRGMLLLCGGGVLFLSARQMTEILVCQPVRQAQVDYPTTRLTSLAAQHAGVQDGKRALRLFFLGVALCATAVDYAFLWREFLVSIGPFLRWPA
jgi:hypothetical protein